MIRRSCTWFQHCMCLVKGQSLHFHQKHSTDYPRKICVCSLAIVALVSTLVLVDKLIVLCWLLMVMTGHVYHLNFTHHALFASGSYYTTYKNTGRSLYSLLLRGVEDELIDILGSHSLDSTCSLSRLHIKPLQYQNAHDYIVLRHTLIANPRHNIPYPHCNT